MERDKQARTGRLHEVDLEIREIRDSIKATKTHGIVYYAVIVAIFFVGFAIGYATHSLVGGAIILIGLAVIAWREISAFRARTAVLRELLREKLGERRKIEEEQEELEIER
jgi:hypothetical protein